MAIPTLFFAGTLFIGALFIGIARFALIAPGELGGENEHNH